MAHCLEASNCVADASERHSRVTWIFGVAHSHTSWPPILFSGEPSSTALQPPHTPRLVVLRRPVIMYHLFKGLHEYMTRKDEYSVVILGLDNVSRGYPVRR